MSSGVELARFGCGWVRLDRDQKVVAFNDVVAAWCRDGEPLAGRRFDGLLAKGVDIYWETVALSLLRRAGQVRDVSLTLSSTLGGRSCVCQGRSDGDGYELAFFPIGDRLRFEKIKAELAVAEGRLRDLERLDRQRRELIDHISHQLNTPLTPMRVDLHILRRRVPTDDEGLQEAVARLDEAHASLQRFAEMATMAARVQAGTIELDVAEFTLAELVQDLVATGLSFEAGEGVRPAADAETTAEQGALVRRLADDDIVARSEEDVYVRGDRRRSLRVMQEIVANAWKYGASRVVVSVDAATGTMVVTDDGAGIAREMLEHVGQPFKELHASELTTALGAGLGLFIAQGLMVLQEGRLEVSSAGLGQGTTVSVRWPTLDD